MANLFYFVPLYADEAKILHIKALSFYSGDVIWSQSLCNTNQAVELRYRFPTHIPAWPSHKQALDVYQNEISN